MKGIKQKPAVDIEFTVREIHIVPGSNKVTVGAVSDDTEIKRIHRTVDIQAQVDSLTDAKLEGVNDLFRKLAALGLGINVNALTGDIFTKST